MAGKLQTLCPSAGASVKPGVDMRALSRAWESSQRSTRDDWDEWMRHFAVVLLQESPSSALRATCDLALVRAPRCSPVVC